jgi:hypothetical protein
MTDVDGIFLQADLGVLICKVHGTGIHPNASAIARHFRLGDHCIKGRPLKEAVLALSHLPLRSVSDVKAHPPVDRQPVQAVPYVKIVQGWSCVACQGDFLTTSLELVRRHVSKTHGLKASSHSEERPLWETCKIQTIFSMNGDSKYFRVRPDNPPGSLAGSEELQPNDPTARSSSSSSSSSTTTSRALNNPARRDAEVDTEAFVAGLRAQRLEHEANATAAANVNPDGNLGQDNAELWMKQLGLDKFVAGLCKDEMAASYKIAKPEPDSLLQDFCDVNRQLLMETYRSCQLGPGQRMTDPQAARISSF